MQSLKGAVQVETAHVVAMHVGVPFATLASQLPNPAAQVIEQAPSVHEGEPLTELHWRPHEPQFDVLVLVLISQPLGFRPSQLPYGAVQDTTWQVPLAQDSEALARSQSTPQAPQLATVLRFVSQPST